MSVLVEESVNLLVEDLVALVDVSDITLIILVGCASLLRGLVLAVVAVRPNHE